jgi:EAL domain-containing protein (putative c-di-GMP-specific phosphodiesterase class I)
MPPGLFVPVAEATGQINALGRRVLEKTCDFLANTEATALGIEYIEVNLSVVQAEKTSLFDEIMNTVRYYKVSPKMINLEIKRPKRLGKRINLLTDGGTLLVSTLFICSMVMGICLYHIVISPFTK